jgi:MYXO-CTERM domain-containing protein
MSVKSVVYVASLAAVTASGIAQASVVSRVTGPGPGNDIIIGDYLIPQIGQVVQTPGSTTLSWSAGASSLAGPTSGVVSNPLYQGGTEAENPFYSAASLRLAFGGLSAILTWASGAPVDLDFTVLFILSDASDASGTPLALLSAKGKGTKNPPPLDPPIRGGNNDDILLGDYTINFSPNQPFTLVKGAPPPRPDFTFRTSEGASWTGLTVVPTPGTAALLGLGGVLAARRRR